MTPDGRSERQRRRKIPLACEPCRIRKSRCDGAKPICSTCRRRSLPLHQCIYTLENARTASNEAYIRVLHDRIRRLERLCTDHGIPTPPIDSVSDDARSPSEPRTDPHSLNPAPRPGETALQPPDPPTRSLPEHAPSPAVSRCRHSAGTPEPDRLDDTEIRTSITAMGTVSTEDDACQAFEAVNEFYGSSSAASFMKEACKSVKPHKPCHPEQGSCSARVPDLPVSLMRPGASIQGQFAYADKFTLPPRSLADHLLGLFFEKVYWLYPFFHKPTFMQAYESLWRPAHEQPAGPSMTGLGLGSSPGADSSTIVFHCALNGIFAIGCQFADLNPREKLTAVETFFNRAKAFVGLDFLDMHNVGVVQALLLMALLLQSTPFASRCWNSVGVACRVAQGLGLHTESGRTARSPLETEIRRRTWHGCVVLDMIVCMIYGRPTMTAHLPSLSLPSTEEFDGEERLPPSVPSRMNFYLEYIRQCRILGEILSSVYQSSQGGTPGPYTAAYQEDSRPHGMDEILKLDDKLTRYESDVNPLLSWKNPCDISHLDESRQRVIITQRTVLRGSFLYLRLMLHRPILTRLCAGAESNTASEPASPTRPDSASQELFKSFASGCARLCLSAAMDLIELVRCTYRTKTTGGWWWDGLYAFTGGLAVILAYLCPALVESLDKTRLESAWMACQEILTHFASFSISAHRSLKLLRKVHADVMSHVSSDKDHPPSSRAGTAPRLLMSTDDSSTSVNGVQGAPTSHANEIGLGGANFQWQFTAAESEMFGGAALFNWDQSLDVIAGGFF